MRLLPGLVGSLLALTTLTACSNPVEQITGGGCEDADKAVVDKVMETVNPDPEINGMRKIEFVRAKVIELPDDMRKFDFDQIMVITTAQFFEEDQVESDHPFPGLENPTTFAVSSETSKVAPIDKFAETSFTITDPAQENPEWDSWVKSITHTDPFDTVRDCADSD